MDVLRSETCWTLNNEIKSKWHQVGLSLFNYQDDVSSNKHKIQYCIFMLGVWFVSESSNTGSSIQILWARWNHQFIKYYYFFVAVVFFIVVERLVQASAKDHSFPAFWLCSQLFGLANWIVRWWYSPRKTGQRRHRRESYTAMLRVGFEHMTPGCD